MLQTNHLYVHQDHIELITDLSVTFMPGELWCVLGRNGTGKTSLLLSLAGLKPYHKGEIILNNQPLEQCSLQKRAHHIGVLLQTDYLPCTHRVKDAINIANILEKNNIEYVLDLLELKPLYHRTLNQLSGGEQQRVRMAMLLAQDPDILILDEPTNHLDLSFQMTLMAILQRYAQQENKLIIMAMHDIHLAKQFSTHSLILFPDHSHAYGQTTQTLTHKHLEKLYGPHVLKMFLNLD